MKLEGKKALKESALLTDVELLELAKKGAPPLPLKDALRLCRACGVAGIRPQPGLLMCKRLTGPLCLPHHSLPTIPCTRSPPPLRFRSGFFCRARFLHAANPLDSIPRII